MELSNILLITIYRLIRTLKKLGYTSNQIVDILEDLTRA